MMLGDLFQDLITQPVVAPEWQKLDVTGLTADSRGVAEGDVFAALSGHRFDGVLFASDAVACGAVAVLTDEASLVDLPASVPVLRSVNPRLTLALAAARLFGPQPEHVVAVTGTNGKTSVAGFVRQIWSLLGVSAASIGTIGVMSDVYEDAESLTTPDPVRLHQTLAKLGYLGVSHVALEASSHGLDQYRMDGVVAKVGIFTNISRDHLDYHGTEAAYFEAKARLFSNVVAPDGLAIVDVEAPGGADMLAIARQRALRVMTLGRSEQDTVCILDRRPAATGSRVVLSWFGTDVTCDIPLVGGFQVSNVLLAAMAVVAMGAEPQDVVRTLPALVGVPGRLELVGHTAQDAPVYVDYAHTPDGLEKVLEALRPHAVGALWCVFGCGGDRDSGKRPLMGAIVDRLADRIIITDDNPRTEDPALIRAQVRETCSRAWEIGDRVEAIETAIAELASGDVLLIAGKGHETGQIQADGVRPHDDRSVARAALQAVVAEGGDPS